VSHRFVILARAEKTFFPGLEPHDDLLAAPHAPFRTDPETDFRMKRRTFLLEASAGIAAASLPAFAQKQSAAHSSLQSPGQPHRGIAHPGILQTRADLDFMKAKIHAGEDPWKSAWDHWIAEPISSLDFEPHASAHIVRGAFGAGQKGGAELMTSAAAVSSHVNQWIVTGDEAHARKVIEIFDAWSSTLADFSENDAMLIAGWTGGEFANAAEILRATYPAWHGQSLQQFKRMLLTVYVPLLRMYYPEANGNWDAAMMFTLLAIGIFCEDRSLMESVYAHYRTGPVNSGITRYVYPSGQCEETTRDEGHVQLGLGYFARTALTAWNQGVDLFAEADNRLALGFEYTAKLLLGEPVPVYGIVVDHRNRFSDVYEGVLEHYRYVKHIDMPYTEKAAQHAREHSRGVVTFFRGSQGSQAKALRATPAPSRIAVLAGAQATPQSESTPSASASDLSIGPADSIQDALDKLAAKGGGTLSLAAGLYTLPATLRLPSNITIAGTGLDCELFLDPGARGFEAAMTNAAPDLHDVTLRDLVIEGAQEPHAPRDPNSGVMHRRSVRGPIRAGIVLLADAGTTIRNLRFEHITVRNCTSSAVELFGADHVDVVNCDFSASGGEVPPGPGKNHNLRLNHVSHVSITGSRLADGMWGSGIFLSFGQNVTVRDCELARNQIDGITIAESSTVTVDSCLAEGNSAHGIAQQVWMEPNRAVVLRNNVERSNAIPS
jgi:parallel beta-helix repeat protein